MPQGTLEGIPGCVAPELLLAKSPGGMPEAVPSAFVPPVIAHDFAGGVTKVVETQTAGLGSDGPTPEAVSAEAICDAILSSEDILIGCDMANRNLKQTILRLGTLDQTSSQKGLGINVTLPGGNALSDS
jgi:hypothetical protein